MNRTSKKYAIHTRHEVYCEYGIDALVVTMLVQRPWLWSMLALSYMVHRQQMYAALASSNPSRNQVDVNWNCLAIVSKSAGMDHWSYVEGWVFGDWMWSDIISVRWRIATMVIGWCQMCPTACHLDAHVHCSSDCRCIYGDYGVSADAVVPLNIAK